MDNILEVKNLKKYFSSSGGQLHAVDDVSFTIERGKTLGVVGESGCGKSTLGRTIIHLYESTDGKILFDGRDITHISHSEIKTLREDIQMIFQDPFASLNPRMSVGQLIAEPLLIYGKMKGRELDRRVAELMDTVGLARRLSNSYPHELDGGRCQRIGVARALALNPKFIVCDEPVSSLDVSIQAQVINLLMELQRKRGLAYVFISHDMAVVERVSHRVAVMYLGQIVEIGPRRQVFENPQHPYTRRLLSAVPVASPAARNRERPLIEGEIPSPMRRVDDPPLVAPLAQVGPQHFVARHPVGTYA